MEDQTNEPTQAPERHLSDSLGWLTSVLLHSAIFIALAFITLPELPEAFGPQLQIETVSLEKIDEALDIEDIAVEISTDIAELAAADTASVDAPSEPLMSEFESALSAPEPVSLSADAMSAPIFSASSSVIGEGVDGRSGNARSTLVASKGGSTASEKAVARGLRWIANHQNPDGTWSLVHGLGPCQGRCDRSAEFSDPESGFKSSLISGTSLALLPYLGAGETHLSGEHKQVVASGLRALILLGKQPNREGSKGVSWRDSGNMYAHAISAIVLTEAYGLTRDPDLRAPAQAAIEYISYAQDPVGGGWRYNAQQLGDTSVTGWQIMALKSAQLAELRIPSRTTKRASRFLDSALSLDGKRFNYTPPKDEEDKPGNGTPSMTAVGMLCRMYMGMDKDDKFLLEGAKYLAELGPQEDNYYQNYYAAQAIFHVTGGEGALWRSWNERMREQLIAQQETEGHLLGSWWEEGAHNDRGGRLYMTSLATMTLEVYYRYLPLFQSAAIDTEFPD